MHDVPAGQAKDALQIERRQDLPRNDQGRKSRRITIDGGNHQVGDLVAMIIPRRAARQHGGRMLAEQAGDMRAVRRQRVIQGGRDQHLHHRILRPTRGARFIKSPVHIGQARRDDDAGCEMIARSRQTGEARQFRQRDIHPQRP